jgi:hypothetical protein
MSLSRRDFIKICGASLSLAALGFDDPRKTHGADCLLLEARAFAEHGGWVLDPQFEDVMGSPYLLAHGMGKPVANARTTAAFPATGSYQLWVRTRNWCPGEWEAPGRFRIHVAGKPLATVFGTEAGWAWQKGGTVEITQAQTVIELQDLTGFEGRCDALFFTKDAGFVPPAEVAPMLAWRRQLMGIPAEPKRRDSFDAVIVGGGVAGCGAALAAARSGLRVALIHDRPVLGGNASSEVRVHTIGIAGKNKAMIGALDTKQWKDGNGSAESLADDQKRHATIDAEPNIVQFLQWRLYDVQVKDGRIISCDAHHNLTGEGARFTAPVFIDCSGDAWLGFRAGAEFRYGRESKHEFDEGWDKYKELWSPEKPDKVTMGVSVLWKTRVAEADSTFPDVPWAKPVAKEHAAVDSEWQWEFARNELDQITDGEEIRDHMFRAIYGSFANAKRDPKHAKRELSWVGHVSGRRESRRLMGDHIYSLKDMVDKRTFPDAVVEEVREVDVHFQRVLTGYPVDYISEAMFMKVGTYYVPFSSLYSKNIKNLMMAGRCFSCTHVGLGGPRVQKTTGQMGIATGYAAALCKKHGKLPREVGKDHIAELRGMIGYAEKSGDTAEQDKKKS